MAGFPTNAVMNGTDGKLWVNDELVASVQSFTLKQKNTYADIHKAGVLSKSRRLLGYELSGTLAKYKIDSSFLRMFENYTQGQTPEVKLIGLLENKNTGVMQRVVVKGVTFDEIDIMNFEQKKELTEELPFEAEEYYWHDLT